MKTKQEILDELVSDRSSCDSFPEFIKCATIGAIENLVNDAMNEYAIEVSKETLRNASENAFMKWHCGHFKTDTPTQYHQFGSDNIQIDKQSILHEYNIPKL